MLLAIVRKSFMKYLGTGLNLYTEEPARPCLPCEQDSHHIAQLFRVTMAALDTVIERKNSGSFL